MIEDLSSQGLVPRLSWNSPTYEKLMGEAKIPDRLFHFTSDTGLIGIAGTEKPSKPALFATHIAYLNDTAERLLGLRLILRALEMKKAESGRTSEEKYFLATTIKRFDLFRHNAPRTFVTSFAGCENLPMYRMYAPPDEGHALSEVDPIGWTGTGVT
jgi:hypothetical protein